MHSRTKSSSSHVRRPRRRCRVRRATGRRVGRCAVGGYHRRDALLVVRDAQRRLCVGSRQAESSTALGRLDAGQSIRDAAPDRRGTREARPRCCARRCPGSLPPGRGDAACARPRAGHRDKGSGSNNEQAESGQSHCGRCAASPLAKSSVLCMCSGCKTQASFQYGCSKSCSVL